MKTFIILLSLISAIEIHSQEVVNETDVAKEMIRQWIQTEKLLSSEKESWKQEKAHISELLVLYEKELKSLNEELATTPSVEQDYGKKQKFKKQIKQDDEKRKQLRNFLIHQKPRILALTKKFPLPLQDQISETVEVLNSLKKDSSARDLLMPMLSVIEAGNSFNVGVFHSNQKVVIGEDEWQAEVIYLGLGRAYFWAGEKAGIGAPSSNNGVWEWRRDDALLKNIKKAISVFNKTTQPELIKLPLRVKDDDF